MIPLSVTIGATGVVLATLGGLGWSLHNASERNTALTASLAVCGEANAGNAATIVKLSKANAEWQEKSRADLVSQHQAVETAVAQQDRLQAELSAERAKRKAIYLEDIDARTWADTAVPAGVVDRLRRSEAARPN